MRVTVTNVISNVGHRSSDFVGLLVIDNSVHIQGIGILLQVPQDSANPAGKWVNILGRPYRVKL
jgi:hypothetical protein